MIDCCNLLLHACSGSFERAPPIKRKGAEDFYYKSVTSVMNNDGDTVVVRPLSHIHSTVHSALLAAATHTVRTAARTSSSASLQSCVEELPVKLASLASSVIGRQWSATIGTASCAM
eukprot:18951-Heterococcus_DN1.PRE.1